MKPPAVHIPADDPRLPEQGEVVELLREVSPVQRHRPLVLLVGQTVVNGSVVCPGPVPHDFHDVDLPAHRPLTEFVLVGGHQPEGRQKPLSLGHPQPGLEQAVGEVVFVLSRDSPGGVGDGSILMNCFDRVD